jgi:hypothetical protein
MEYMALMKDPHLQPLWQRCFGNECGRLLQGIQNVPGTDTCFFIKLTNIPKDRKITYGKIVCDYKNHKKEKERVQLTVGGDRIDYSGNVATSTANITTLKILINSTLSIKDATMMMMGIEKYYLGTRLPRFEYMKMPLSHFPEEIVQQYNLNALAVDGWVRVRHVRFVTSGITRQPITANSLSTIWVLPSTAHPGTLVTKNAANLFHSHRGRFRSQVRGQIACRASPERLIANLRTHDGMDGEGILRHDLEMGLQQQDMRHLHAWLRFKCLKQISTRCPKASTTYPVPVCHARLRRQDSICNEG